MASASLTHTTVQPSSTNGGAQVHATSGHSGRLRYAEPQDLPSFPSIGLKKNGGAANVAATLGWESQKPVQLWRPDASASASAAAVLAKDYKMAPLWEPQKSDAGSRAAILAAESAGRHAKHHSTPPSMWGSSAANQAFKSGSPPSPSRLPPDSAELARQGSLHAAKGAMAGSRPRSKSSPIASKQSYPDEVNAAANALNAATVAHRPYVRPATIPIEEAGAVPYTTMDRQMFTSHPPVKPEVDEQRRNDVIHASAVAMAKRMYNQQQKMAEQTKEAHTDASRRGLPVGDMPRDDNIPIMRFTNLQDAAFRLAQERLAKIHDEHQKNREYQEYYGSSPTQQQRRFTIRDRLRRRASSDGDVVEDRRRSQQIRQQMSLFSTKLSEVDEQKRQRDREALLAAAQRNVRARLQGMDEKLQAESGRAPAAHLGEWELKAHAAAQARSESRKNPNVGKVDIGGGKFMDQKEIDEIAARRVKPVLDEINEKAEKERERQTAIRLEEAAKREELEKKRAKEKEVQEIHKKLKGQQKEEDKARAAEIKHQEKAKKDEEKARVAEVKHQEKAKKEEEKAAKTEQKRLTREERRKSKETHPESSEQHQHQQQQPQQQQAQEQPARQQPQQQPRQRAQEQKEESKEPETKAPTKVQTVVFQSSKLHAKRKGTVTPPPADIKPPAPKSPTSPTSPTSDASASASPSSKVKTWWKKLSRPRAQSASAAEGVEPVNKGENDRDPKATLGGLQVGHASATSVDDTRSASMREVALAGRPRDLRPTGGDERGESSGAAPGGDPQPRMEEAKAEVVERERDEVSSVSSLSSDDGSDDFVEAKDGLDSKPPSFMTPPKKVALAEPDATLAGLAHSSKESRFVEAL